MAAPARLREDDVACWLLKTAGPLSAVPVSPGEVSRARRCVRPSYRLGLMRPGDPCVLWLSGRDAGVRAVGRLVAAPGPDAVEVELLGLHHPLARRELLEDARFRAAEVVRMAAGSNPSYLAGMAWAAVCERLEPGALRAVTRGCDDEGPTTTARTTTAGTLREGPGRR